MKLKKLIPELVEGIKSVGFDENPKEIQTKGVPQIKSGSDFFMISPEGSGKSTAIVIGVIERLKESYMDTPRAIIMASTKEKAFALEAQFDLLGKKTDLRTFVAFDKGVLDFQKESIYEGVDIVIGNPKRLSELLKINGIPLGSVNMLIVDGLDELRPDKYHLIYALTKSTNRSQFIMTASAWHNSFDVLSEEIMKNPKVVK